MEGDREEEEKTGGREIEKTQRKVLRGKRKEREAANRGGGEDRRQERRFCSQLGAQRAGGETMGRRWPLRGRAVHWATFPFKLAPCFLHGKKKKIKATANPTDSEIDNT